MTPNDIEVLIHCYVCTEPHPRRNDPDVRDAIDMFLKEGLIYEDGSGCYSTTERGIAHLEQLGDVPFPKQAWLDADGQVIHI